MTKGFRSIKLDYARISPKTIWTFLRLEDHEGRIGTGEATLAGREALLEAAAQQCLPAWKNGDDYPQGPLEVLSLPVASLWSAFQLARDDLAGQRKGKPLTVLHGGDPDASIPLYANINRRTNDRSPQGFADSAGYALGRGFSAFKIAPFDGVTPSLCAKGEAGSMIKAGLERIAAVREEIGADARLMVDCHWRFTPEAARSLVSDVAAFGLYWLECPIAETESHIDSLVGLRGLCNKSGMRLAGLEEFVGAGSFQAFAQRGAYDVMMPDMKYVGGPDEMLRTAKMLQKNGVEFSPHNPTGPICHVGSLHLCATMPGTMLEIQLDESALFTELATPALPDIVGGVSRLPDGPGLGIALDEALLASLRCGSDEVSQSPIPAA
ncbi:MAG: mandelate racemase/muconate lactonizing enzyme family protein [Beijerinckiaceae bacterium]